MFVGKTSVACIVVRSDDDAADGCALPSAPGGSYNPLAAKQWPIVSIWATIDGGGSCAISQICDVINDRDKASGNFLAGTQLFPISGVSVSLRLSYVLV